MDELEDFVWIWEVSLFVYTCSFHLKFLSSFHNMISLRLCSNQIEEEFRDYLPTYTNLLYAVDKFIDGMKVSYFTYEYFTNPKLIHCQVSYVSDTFRI